MTSRVEISSVEELLAHAKAIESEAMEQYQDLAEQMEVHHNADTAELFRKMAEVESLHVQKILERAEGVDLRCCRGLGFRPECFVFQVLAEVLFHQT